MQLYAICRKCILVFDTNTLKLKGCKNIHHANSDLKRAGVTIAILDEIDFNNLLLETREAFYNNKSVHQWDSKNRIKGEIDILPIRVEDLKSQIESWIEQIGRKSRRK